MSLSNFREFHESPETTLSLQSNLEFFKNQIPLKRNEIYAPNEYYGNNVIYKYFANLQADIPLYFSIPHGIEFYNGKTLAIFHKRESLALSIYLNSSGLEIASENNFSSKMISGPHPILLLERIIEDSGNRHVNPLLGDRSLLFPAHTTPSWDIADPDYDSDLIDILLSDFNPKQITVCLPSFDLRRQRHFIYQKAGFKVVTAGDIGDPKFTCRLLNLICMHGEIWFNDLGSHVLYAAATHNSVRFLGTSIPGMPSWRNAHGQIETSYEIYECYIPLLAAIQNRDGTSREIARKLLGFKESVMPDSIAEFQEIGRRLYYFGYFSRYRFGIKYSPPRFLVNPLRMFAKKAIERIHKLRTVKSKLRNSDPTGHQKWSERVR